MKSKMKSSRRAREASSPTPLAAGDAIFRQIQIVTSPDFGSTPSREPRGHYAGPLLEPPEKEEENDGPPEF